MNLGCSVYVMVQKETGRVKVGRSVRPLDRRHLLSGKHGKLRLHFSTPRIADGLFVEALAHQMLRDKREVREDREREWYMVSPDEAKSVVERAFQSVHKMVEKSKALKLRNR